MATMLRTPPRARRALRASARPLAAVGLVVGVASALSGGVLLALHATSRDADGYYASGARSLRTPGFAIVDERVELGGAPRWLVDGGRLGTLRLRARPAAGRPLFVGVAPSAAVARYLAGVARATVADVRVDLFALRYRLAARGGSVTPAAPVAQRFWSARAVGPGPQTLRWRLRPGRFAIVVMNADGSPGVAAEVRVGARLGIVAWLGLGLLAAGAALTAALAVPLCRRRVAPRLGRRR
jgi:hypothetical protein